MELLLGIGLLTVGVLFTGVLFIERVFGEDIWKDLVARGIWPWSTIRDLRDERNKAEIRHRDAVRAGLRVIADLRSQLAQAEHLLKLEKAYKKAFRTLLETNLTESEAEVHQAKTLWTAPKQRKAKTVTKRAKTNFAK